MSVASTGTDIKKKSKSTMFTSGWKVLDTRDCRCSGDDDTINDERERGGERERGKREREERRKREGEIEREREKGGERGRESERGEESREGEGGGGESVLRDREREILKTMY